MNISIVLLILLSLVEFVLFFILFRFFARLKRSEDGLASLQENQGQLLDKLHMNAQLEQELVQSFARRQSELITLNRKLEERAAELTHLVEQAEAISRSPQFLRELILTGHSKGRTADQLAKATGLSRDEVELILAQTSKEGTARR